jgi:hypothetical protein
MEECAFLNQIEKNQKPVLGEWPQQPKCCVLSFSWKACLRNIFQKLAAICTNLRRKKFERSSSEEPPEDGHGERSGSPQQGTANGQLVESAGSGGHAGGRTAASNGPRSGIPGAQTAATTLPRPFGRTSITLTRSSAVYCI